MKDKPRPFASDSPNWSPCSALIGGAYLKYEIDHPSKKSSGVATLDCTEKAVPIPGQIFKIGECEEIVTEVLAFDPPIRGFDGMSVTHEIRFTRKIN